MKKHFKSLSTILSIMVLSTAISCKKDQKLTSDAKEVTTTMKGDTYNVDAANSKIEWKGYKLFKSDNSSHFGEIKLKSGAITVLDGKLESGKFLADMPTLTSIDLKDDEEQLGKLNTHLKSADFFDVEKYPTAMYEITKVSPSTSGDYNTILDGNLTIKDITKPVQFNANVTVDKGMVTIATEPKDIMREDFGVKFQVAIENGVLKNEVTLQISIKANK